MNKLPLLALAVLCCLAPAAAPRADALSPDERAFFDKHISQFIQIEPARLRSGALDRVFHATFYDVTVTIKEGDGSETMKATLARNGDELAEVSKPSTTEDVPKLKEMLNPQFKLSNQKDADTLQDGLDILYPIDKGFGGKDLKAKAIKHTGNQWLFIRGEFFQKHSGFVFTTDAAGAITSVKYSLELP